MEPTYVFVYGTLQKGYGNNYLLRDSKFVGKAVTNEEYLLVDVGFPYIIQQATNQPTHQVMGELYLVENEDVIRDLDWLEGVDSDHYRRVKIECFVENEVTVEAWVYVKANPLYLRYGAEVCQTIVVDGVEMYVWRVKEHVAA